MPHDDSKDAASMSTYPAAPTESQKNIIDGRYEILDLLGEGGMGSVFRARHILMEKKVAIKLIHPSLSSLPDVTKRFEREAQSASRLTHPNCITVTDFGKSGVDLYLVMELLEGDSLSDRMKTKDGLNISDSIKITVQILKGLAHAHEAGVIHRDLKPENIILTTHGDEKNFVKILDFGIAKLASTSDNTVENLTQSGVMFGTPGYLAPEQALGDPVDHRADLYSVGILLFEMLMGKKPFVGDTAMSIISQHVNDPVPDLDEDKNFPEGLQEIIDKAMSKNPQNRFNDANSFIHALDKIDISQPAINENNDSASLKTKTYSVTQRVANLILKNRKISLGAVLFVILLFVVWAVAFIEPKKEGDLTKLVAVDNNVVDGQKIEQMLQKADEQIRNGIPGEAYVTLKETLTIDQKQPITNLLLGHAEFLLGKRKESMDSYEKALILDKTLITDVRMSQHLQKGLKWTAARTHAAMILGKFGKKKDLNLLADNAKSALVGKEIRKASRIALLKNGHKNQINWLASLTADFNDAKNCKEKNEIVERMGKTGNKAFLPWLKAHNVDNNSGKIFKKGKGFYCIALSVKQAILLLEGS